MASNTRLWWKRRLARWPPIYRAARRLRRTLLRSASAPDAWDERVAAVEDHQGGGWLDSHFIEQEYVRPRISGSRHLYYVDYFLREHLREQPQRLLSLGCGGGNLERQLMALGAVQNIDAIDSSPGSIRVARDLAHESGLEGIDYRVADLNVTRLQPGAYGAVVAKQSLHHVENLEHLYEQIELSLQPGGVFMFNEFVGPSRFQWTDRQLELANELFDTLPSDLRRKIGLPGIDRPSVEDVIADDPSESVRSSEILPLLEERFEVVEHRPYGGTLLNLVLTPAVPYLDESLADHQELLRRCFLFESDCIERGLIDNDFAYVVARPRAS